MNYKFETVQKDNGVDLVCSATVDRSGNFIPSTVLPQWRNLKTKQDFLDALADPVTLNNSPKEILSVKFFPNGLFTESDKEELIRLCEVKRKSMATGNYKTV